MSLFSSRPKTAHQKAQWAKTRIVLRVIALLYVVFYVIIPMLDPDIEDVEAIHPALRYGILAFFILACAALIVGTIIEYVKGNKSGKFKAESYTDDE